MVSKDNRLSVRRQCGLLTLARSNLYYQPKGTRGLPGFLEVISRIPTANGSLHYSAILS